MSSAIRDWVVALDDYPGWREWNRAKLGHTLHFDEDFRDRRDWPNEFKFDVETDKQHAVIMRYLTLLQTSTELRDLEYYFRRFPYAGTPVSRYAHLSNVCELYFSRFYQYKERLKGLFDAVRSTLPDPEPNVGRLVKQLDKAFGPEMRERNGVHHRERFEDVAISRVFLIEGIVLRDPQLASKGWDREHRRVYRLAAKEWAKRCINQSRRLDTFSEIVAGEVLHACSFLRPRSVS